MPTRAERPYQGRADADPKGIVPGAGLEPACACFKGRLGCRQPTPERTGGPARCHLWLADLTKAARSLELGQVRSAGLEPAITWPSTMPVYLSAARAQESRHPVPTRAIRRTKAEPQPCAAAKLPSLDSNQEPLGSEPSAAAG